MSGAELAEAIREIDSDAVTDHSDDAVWVTPSSWPDVAEKLRDLEALRFEMLTLLTTVDYVDHFEVVYHLVSLSRNRTGVVKIRCGEGRVSPSVPTAINVWRGADLQEREAYDLMGVNFDGHPNMKRLMLWEGFEGHPLRKDYLR
ncbi:MAG: NADH-quinone oxidoreductase subunit C [Chloroflexi bacterium]|nr:NADH-quinone oxidoreductase subunit C [Chloroflexota bacterium]